MKKNVSLLLCSILFLCNPGPAIKGISEVGKCSMDELTMLSYAKDTSAEAVVLYDKGRSFFVLTGNASQLIFQRGCKIKILKKSGLNWAEEAIRYHSSQEVSEIKGKTYTLENGVARISTLQSNAVFEQNVNDQWRVKKFAMPDVKVGSVIEISYQIASPFRGYIPSWKFQGRIPVMYSQYKVEMVPFFDFNFLLQGADRFDGFKQYQDLTNTQSIHTVPYHVVINEYIMKDVQAFKDEAFVACPEDFMIRLDFQFAGYQRTDGYKRNDFASWESIGKGFLEHDDFGEYIKKSRKAAEKIIDTMPLSMKAPKEKATIIERYLKNNFKWDGENNVLSDKSVGEFLVSKEGNSAAINLFYAGMLRKAGIEAYPIIISTRDHGEIIPDCPFEYYFNYVFPIAKINDGFMLLDATDPLSNFNEIPTQCLNERGLIIKEGSADWLVYQSPFGSFISYTMNIRPDVNSDSLKTAISISAGGYFALSLRKACRMGQKQLKDSLHLGQLNITDSLKIHNVTDIEKPFEIDVTAFSGSDKVENKIVIPPFCGMPIDVNPLTHPTRRYPIDMAFKSKKIFKSVIHIPRGYTVMHRPDSLTINNDNAEIYYRARVTDSNTVIAHGVVEFKKDKYEKELYPEIKSYFASIVRTFNEKITLGKKE